MTKTMRSWGLLLAIVIVVVSAFGGAQASLAASVNPEVLGVNTPPTDLSLSDAEAKENHAPGYHVSTISNNDPDPLDLFTYSLCGGADDAYFSITDNSLQSTVIFDYEMRSVYSDVCIQVDDGQGGVYQEHFAITIGDLPEKFHSLGAQDGYIIEFSENSSTGGAVDSLGGTLAVGDGNNDQQYRAILSFNTGSLPDTTVVTSAILKVKRASIVGTDPFTTHGKIKVDVRKGPFTNNPALQPNDFQSAPSLARALVINNLPLGGWYKGKMPADNLIYINTLGLTQFRLRFTLTDNDDLNADFISFLSGNSATNRPILILKYYIP